MRFINQQSLKVASVFEDDNFSFIIFLTQFQLKYLPSASPCLNQVYTSTLFSSSFSSLNSHSHLCANKVFIFLIFCLEFLLLILLELLSELNHRLIDHLFLDGSSQTWKSQDCNMSSNFLC